MPRTYIDAAIFADSAQEQTGFEPPVPLAKARVIFGEEKGPEVISVVSKDVVFFPGGPVVRIPLALAESQERTEQPSRCTRVPLARKLGHGTEASEESSAGLGEHPDAASGLGLVRPDLNARPGQSYAPTVNNLSPGCTSRRLVAENMSTKASRESGSYRARSAPEETKSCCKAAVRWPTRISRSGWTDGAKDGPSIAVALGPVRQRQAGKDK